MRENFLHFIWQHQRYDHIDVTTTDGEKVQVINPGILNNHDGPDFLNAILRIGETLWTGSVELHVDGKDWYYHKHHKDTNYSNVVLHVVYRNSVETKNIGGHKIPSLELGGKIPLSLLHRFEQLQANSSIIACSNHIQDIDQFLLFSWKERLVVERLESKVHYFESILNNQNGDWEGTFFQILTRNFGVHANTDAFELLAESIDYHILLKHRNNPIEVEALLFGQAGLLDRSFKDVYPNTLKKEYLYLKRKYKLKSIPKEYWLFKRLRPMAFPTIRLAQLAQLIQQYTPLFSTFNDSENPVELLQKVKVSSYWETHYTFDNVSNKKIKRIGEDFATSLVINAFLPTLFAMGKATAVPDLCIQSIEYLHQLKPETNRKTNLWKQLGLDSENAADSQAFIQLINSYCMPKNCLRCPIGCQILKGDDYIPPKTLKEPEIFYN